MKRYAHNYGGIATEVGTFPRKQVEEYFKERISYSNTPMKVLDIIGDRREVLVYTVRDSLDLRVVCINR